jgi:uncharacterized protein YegP (UPF0339 family)
MKRKIKIITYKAKDGFRWHMIRNGRIIAESGEGYKREGGCIKTAQNLVKALAEGAYVFEKKS